MPSIGENIDSSCCIFSEITSSVFIVCFLFLFFLCHCIYLSSFDCSECKHTISRVYVFVFNQHRLLIRDIVSVYVMRSPLNQIAAFDCNNIAQHMEVLLCRTFFLFYLVLFIMCAHLKYVCMRNGFSFALKMAKRMLSFLFARTYSNDYQILLFNDISLFESLLVLRCQSYFQTVAH